MILFSGCSCSVVPFHVQYFACQSDIDLNFDGDGKREISNFGK